MARKGAGTFYLEVTGKASNAGLQPELGASAIWDLAQKVAALHALTDLEKAPPSTSAPCAWQAPQRRRQPRVRGDRPARVEPGRGDAAIATCGRSASRRTSRARARASGAS